MPTLIGTATVDLAPADAATGSAVVNTARQAGYALGVSGLVAILGSQGTVPTGDAFRNGWIFVTLLVLVSAMTALTIRRPGSRAEGCAWQIRPDRSHPGRTEHGRVASVSRHGWHCSVPQFGSGSRRRHP
ncbi:hypothetical protein [Nocardia sp.]|uniref:hypothetical protein n=1 Tax=Nocardia sp. TaxID=1821 RepID=UPI0025882B84|nr:hypothetical protein [Nocardia sp.]